MDHSQPETGGVEDQATIERREAEENDRRKEGIERRAGAERRHMSAAEAGYTGPDRRATPVERRTGLERRRGPGRRRSDDRRSAEEGEMTVEQFEFVMAIEIYKKVNKRLYPTWREILEVFQQLGYRKVAPRKIRMENVPEPELLARRSCSALTECPGMAIPGPGKIKVNRIRRRCQLIHDHACRKAPGRLSEGFFGWRGGGTVPAK